MDILKTFLTFVIAAAAIVIAWRQYRTAREKFRLDLYEKRYKVYRGLMEFLACVIRDGEASPQVLADYYKTTDEKRFLFGPDIGEYMTEVRQKASQLRLLKQQVEQQRNLTDVQRDPIIENMLDNETWLSKQAEETQHRFQPYLEFAHKL